MSGEDVPVNSANPEEVTPNVTAPPAETPTVPDQVNPFAYIMAKAGKQSLEQTLNEMLNVVASEKATIPKDLQVTDEEIDNMGPEEVSKLSCKCLVRAQTYLCGQVASNRGSLQLIVVAVKFLQAMAAQMEVAFEGVKEATKGNAEGVDASLGAFTEAFGNFINTMKDLVAGIRASSPERKASQEGFNKTLQQLEEYCKHVRGNTNDIKGSASHIKTIATNIQWELSELRTGGKAAATGAVDSNGGSQLAAIGVSLQNESTNLLEGITKIAHNVQGELGDRIQESIERGTNPAKSLKRKREEEDQEEFQRAKEELEKKKREEEEEQRLREQTVLVTHPYTGEQMMLNHAQRVQFFQDLQYMRADQFPPKGTGRGSMPSMPQPIPAMGFPPHMPQHMGYGPFGTPSTPSAPVAPATLPVLSEGGAPMNTAPGSFAYGGKPA